MRIFSAETTFDLHHWPSIQKTLFKETKTQVRKFMFWSTFRWLESILL